MKILNAMGLMLLATNAVFGAARRETFSPEDERAMARVQDMFNTAVYDAGLSVEESGVLIDLDRYQVLEEVAADVVEKIKAEGLGDRVERFADMYAKSAKVGYDEELRDIAIKAVERGEFEFAKKIMLREYKDNGVESYRYRGAILEAAINAGEMDFAREMMDAEIGPDAGNTYAHKAIDGKERLKVLLVAARAGEREFVENYIESIKTDIKRSGERKAALILAAVRSGDIEFAREMFNKVDTDKDAREEALRMGTGYMMRDEPIRILSGSEDLIIELLNKGETEFAREVHTATYEEKDWGMRFNRMRGVVAAVKAGDVDLARDILNSRVEKVEHFHKEGVGYWSDTKFIEEEFEARNLVQIMQVAVEQGAFDFAREILDSEKWEFAKEDIVQVAKAAVAAGKFDFARDLFTSEEKGLTGADLAQVLQSAIREGQNEVAKNLIEFFVTSDSKSFSKMGLDAIESMKTEELPQELISDLLASTKDRDLKEVLTRKQDWYNWLGSYVSSPEVARESTKEAKKAPVVSKGVLEEAKKATKGARLAGVARDASSSVKRGAAGAAKRGGKGRG
ncbi:MAG: hypothetical protein RLN62_04160 [Rickettsiales bacterium]